MSVAATTTVTVPSHGAVTGVSIFITSMTRISSPLETFCPLDAVTRRIVPGTGAFTSVPPAPPEEAPPSVALAEEGNPAFVENATSLPLTTALPSPLISTP